MIRNDERLSPRSRWSANFIANSVAGSTCANDYYEVKVDSVGFAAMTSRKCRIDVAYPGSLA